MVLLNVLVVLVNLCEVVVFFSLFLIWLWILDSGFFLVVWILVNLMIWKLKLDLIMLEILFFFSVSVVFLNGLIIMLWLKKFRLLFLEVELGLLEFFLVRLVKFVGFLWIFLSNFLVLVFVLFLFGFFEVIRIWLVWCFFGCWNCVLWLLY